MANFPTTFSPGLQLLTPSIDLGRAANETVLGLADRGLVAGYGMPYQFVDDLSRIAMQSHIVEYCPNDQSDRRFVTASTTAQWLGKNGGRGMVWIAKLPGVEKYDVRDVESLSTDEAEFRAYGWSGIEPNEHIPGADVTTAYRVAKEGARQGLGSALTKLLMGVTVEVFGVEDPSTISLEAWESNVKAVNLYDSHGFVQRARVEDTRFTLAEVGEVIGGHTVYEGEIKGKHGHVVQDARLFKQFDPSFLDKAA